MYYSTEKHHQNQNVKTNSSKANIFEELKQKELEVIKLGNVGTLDSSDSKYKFEFIPTNEYN